MDLGRLAGCGKGGVEIWGALRAWSVVVRCREDGETGRW